MLAYVSRLSLAFFLVFINVLAALMVYGTIGPRSSSGAAAQTLPQSNDGSGISITYQESPAWYPEFTNLATYPHLQKITKQAQ